MLVLSLFKILESAFFEIFDNKKMTNDIDTYSGSLKESEIDDSLNLIEKQLDLEEGEGSFADDSTTSSDISHVSNDKENNFNSNLSVSSVLSDTCSIEEELPSKSDQDLLLALNDALHCKNVSEVIFCVESISNWKLTFANSNFSVLSLLSRHARPQTLGTLYHQNAVEIFKPLLEGNHHKLSGGYFYALALFKPSIQRNIINRLIHKIPHLRGVLLLVAIYYRLDVKAVSLILGSGAVINFGNDDEISLLTSLPSLDPKTKYDLQTAQVPVSRSLFMTFFDTPLSSFREWERKVSADPEEIFLSGMLTGGLPEECGAFKVALNNYCPGIVKGLMKISPNHEMKNYHLAHFLALNPEKQKQYPVIERLVSQELVFDRLRNGFSDVVALALVKNLSPSDQVSMIDEFLSKTTIFNYTPLNNPNPRTITTINSKEFSEKTGIYELPSSPAHTFFLAACKSDLSDEAFMKIFEACRNIQTKFFRFSRRSALKWFKFKELKDKVELLSQILKVTLRK